jgi:hypothetical protein
MNGLRPDKFCMFDGSVSSRLIWSLALVAWAVALFSFGGVLSGLEKAYLPLPFWDMWSVVNGWQQVEERGLLSYLFHFHNEHLLVLPKVLFLINESLTRGSLAALIGLNLLLNIGLWIALVWLGRRVFPLQRSSSWLLHGLLFGVLTSGMQFENQLLAFQNQFYLVYLFSLLAFAASAHLPRKTRALVLFVLLSVGAAFSMANGFLIPLVLGVAALMDRHGFKPALLWFGLLLLSLFTYFLLRPSADPAVSAFPAFGQILRLPLFVLCFFGAPFSQLHPASAGVSFALTMLGGVLSLGLFILALLRRGQLSGEQSQLYRVCLLTQGFIFLSGVLIALGRVDHGLETAFSSRYLTPVLLFWGLFVFQGFLAFSPGPAAAGSRPPFWVVFPSLLLLGLLSWQQRIWIDFYAMWFGAKYSVYEQVRMGIYHRESLLEIYPWPESLPSILEESSARRTYAFRRELPEWLGGSLPEHFAVVSDPTLRGYFEHMEDLSPGLLPESQPGVLVGGWAWSDTVGYAPSLILLVDQDDRIRGWARGGKIEREDLGLDPYSFSWRAGWKGAATLNPDKSSSPDKSLRAFAVDPAGQIAWPLAPVHRVFGEALLPAQFMTEAGITFVPVESLQLEGSARENGFFQAFAPFSPDVPSWGTFSQSDSDTGRISFDVTEIQPLSPIYLPILTGPSASGLTIHLYNQDGDEIHTLFPASSGGQWALLPLPGELLADGPIRLEIRDEGEDFGQWIAVSLPLQIP